MTQTGRIDCSKPNLSYPPQGALKITHAGTGEQILTPEQRAAVEQVHD